MLRMGKWPDALAHNAITVRQTLLTKGGACRTTVRYNHPSGAEKRVIGHFRRFLVDHPPSSTARIERGG